MYYYINYYKNDNQIVVIELDRGTGTGSIFGRWKIVQYISGEPGDAGHADNLQPGMTVSGNEFNGVGMSGTSKYIFSYKQTIIKNLFNL